MITSPSGRIYVGSTDDIKDRWRHYYKVDCIGQTKLYNSLKKYGPENHVFEVVWSGDILKMFEYETLIGWGFNSLDSKLGLNCKLPKLGDVWSSVSDETRSKMSSSAKIKIFTKEHKDNIAKGGKKAIIQYDKQMNFIRDWNSALDASSSLNIDHSCIIKVCKGKRINAGGFKWKYKP